MAKIRRVNESRIGSDLCRKRHRRDEDKAYPDQTSYNGTSHKMLAVTLSGCKTILYVLFRFI